MNLSLLEKLCQIHAPSGDEERMTEFLLNYIDANAGDWLVRPKVYSGEGFQNCVVLVFGQPKTAIYAHIDSIGYTVGYDNELLLIGKPVFKEDIALSGIVDGKRVNTRTELKRRNGERKLFAADPLPPGTTLVYTPNFRLTDTTVESPYMDNRMGVWNALKVAETLENGMIAFSCWEEHGGGAVGYLARFMYEVYQVKQALISDITWVTKGVKAGEGVAVSLRDSGIPRKKYTDKIVRLAEKSGIPFQLELESAGGSDGNELQKSPYPIDWCFIGAPEKAVHSPDENVNLADVKAMNQLYSYLMKHL